MRYRSACIPLSAACGGLSSCDAMWRRCQRCAWLRLALLAGVAAAARPDRNEGAPSGSATPNTAGGDQHVLRARVDRGGGRGAADIPPSTPPGEHDINDNYDKSKMRTQYTEKDENKENIQNLRYILAKKQAMLNEYLKRKAQERVNAEENRVSIERDNMKKFGDINSLIKSGGVSAAAVQHEDDMTAPPLEAALLRLEGDSEQAVEDDAKDLAAQRKLAGFMRRMQDSRRRPPLTASGERRAERALALIGGHSGPSAPAGPGQGRWLRAALGRRAGRGAQDHPYDDHAWSKEFSDDMLFGGNKWI